jgi:hypothetical protein
MTAMMSGNGTKQTYSQRPECPLMAHFGHQRPAYGPGADRARALYLECCTCRSVRGRCSQERQEFAPDQVESSRRGYGVRGINLDEEIE